jgi:hypothetical protein
MKKILKAIKKFLKKAKIMLVMGFEAFASGANAQFRGFKI